ncbi:hypothetical protein [Methanosarcina barkeri]|uniref:hypothetical protein n=1 Tax=Methanosarcina barkeri TaxID=2208 RepID=UPI001FB2D8F6|nr:hypothetical protein [Methanosarcina barkeri]
MLAAFREMGKPPYVLCTVGMLIEGFDFPELEALILLRPTLSMRLFEQQVGRVTRLSSISGKKQGNIFEISDSIDSLYQRFGEGVFFPGKRLTRCRCYSLRSALKNFFQKAMQPGQSRKERSRLRR